MHSLWQDLSHITILSFDLVVFTLTLDLMWKTPFLRCCFCCFVMVAARRASLSSDKFYIYLAGSRYLIFPSKVSFHRIPRGFQWAYVTVLTYQKGMLIHQTPVPVPFWTCICADFWDQSFQIIRAVRTSNISRYVYWPNVSLTCIMCITFYWYDALWTIIAPGTSFFQKDCLKYISWLHLLRA